MKTPTNAQIVNPDAFRTRQDPKIQGRNLLSRRRAVLESLSAPILLAIRLAIRQAVLSTTPVEQKPNTAPFS